MSSTVRRGHGDNDAAHTGRGRRPADGGPPATVSFHATAIVHSAGSPAAPSVTKELASLLPAERRTSACIVEVIPEGSFLTNGLGVSLQKMRDPAAARGRVSVTQEGGTR